MLQVKLGALQSAHDQTQADAKVCSKSILIELFERVRLGSQCPWVMLWSIYDESQSLLNCCSYGWQMLCLFSGSSVNQSAHARPSPCGQIICTAVCW